MEGEVCPGTIIVQNDPRCTQQRLPPRECRAAGKVEQLQRDRLVDLVNAIVRRPDIDAGRCLSRCKSNSAIVGAAGRRIGQVTITGRAVQKRPVAHRHRVDRGLRKRHYKPQIAIGTFCNRITRQRNKNHNSPPQNRSNLLILIYVNKIIFQIKLCCHISAPCKVSATILPCSGGIGWC